MGVGEVRGGGEGGAREEGKRSWETRKGRIREMGSLNRGVFMKQSKGTQ